MRRSWVVFALLALAGCSAVTAPDPAQRPAIPARARDAAPWIITRDSVR